MFGVEVRGAEKLEKLGKRLKAEGESGKGFRKELLRNIREGAKPVIPDVRASGRSKPPEEGGLAALVGRSKVGVRTRLSGKNVGVEIRATGDAPLRGLNRGRFRHPVFGNREVWVSQKTPKGWFDDPIKKHRRGIHNRIQRAMKDTARKIEGN